MIPYETTTLAQPIGLLLRGSRAIKPRVRNVRRLQLVFLNLFYELIHLDMPCCASELTSKPVQPLICYSSSLSDLIGKLLIYGTGSVEWDLRTFTLDFIGNQSLISIKSTSYQNPRIGF